MLSFFSDADAPEGMLIAEDAFIPHSGVHTWSLQNVEGSIIDGASSFLLQNRENSYETCSLA